MKTNIVHLSPYTLKAKIANSEIQVVDVREHYEYELGAIPSLHLPMAEVSGRIAELEQFSAICLVCKSGKRALAVADLLVSEGVDCQILVLEGGLEKYKEEIAPELILSI
ncbi:MAG: rhodanese-like domain-containing protein [Crocinitomicaceae bacterium]|nr:rhodanese-like domain-containing protein [Crocinitomicaceae bacterium]